jgi:hypothetical protein
MYIQHQQNQPTWLTTFLLAVLGGFGTYIGTEIAKDLARKHRR